jgi:Protein of unknown function (DUF1761)
VIGFLLQIAGATLVAFVLGIVWYAPFGLGEHWLEAVGKRPEDLRGSLRPMAASLLALVVSATALGAVLRVAGVASVGGGAFLGGLAGVLVAAAMLSDYLFCGWPLGLFAIQASYRVAYLVLMGAVLAVWS